MRLLTDSATVASIPEMTAMSEVIKGRPYHHWLLFSGLCFFCLAGVSIDAGISIKFFVFEKSTLEGQMLKMVQHNRDWMSRA